MTITQSTPIAAINWQSFNIAKGEAVRFMQPDSNSVVLNRVLGSNPSSILGTLSANGSVFLVNPGGIFFGKGAQVNVGGLVASTLTISNSELLSGTFKFLGMSRGTILNQGTINTNSKGGYVALLGANVSNEGVISAKLGSVVLAAGNAITLDVAGDGLLNVVVNQGTVNALVQNGGLIQADGGQVLLTAQAAGNLLQSVVNNTGVIQAQTLENRNGTIKLLADMQSGTVKVSGTLAAQGGANSGDGGFVETSGNRVLIAEDARVDTLAPHGKTGLWLLDPVNYVISGTGDETPASVVSSLATSDRLISATNDITVGSPVTWTPVQMLTLSAGHDVLINAPMNAVTAGARLVLTAGNDVNISAPLTITAAGSSIQVTAGNNVITSAPIMAVAAASPITIDAGNDVLIGGAVTGTAADTAININAGRDLTANAAITAVAAGSLIKLKAGRDLTTTTTAALLATAANTVINLSAGHNVNVNSAIAASAAGSSINLLSGLDGTGPGVAGGTVSIAAAVASLNTTIRFNPNGYVNTSAEIAGYVTKVTGAVDAKAWVFVGGNNKTYDGANSATLSIKGNPGAGGAVMLNPGTATFDNKNAGTAKIVNFSGSAISGPDVGRFSLFAASGTTTADVNTRVLTLTSANKIYDGTSNAVTLADNRIPGDALTLSNVIASFVDKNTGNGKSVNVTGLNLSGTDSLNYSPTTVLATAADITKAALTVTASNASKIYGQTQTLTAFTQAGLMNGESIGGVTESSPGMSATAGVVGGPYVITPTGASGGNFSSSNYSISYVNGTLTVNPAGLTVTAANATKTYGQTMTLTAFTVAGLVNGETIGAFTETSPGTVASATVAGSPYLITASKAAGGTFIASNYTIVYVDGELTVTPLIRPLSVVALPVSQASGGPVEQVGMTIVVMAEPPAQLLSLGLTLPLSELRDAEPVEMPIVLPAPTPPKI